MTGCTPSTPTEPVLLQLTPASVDHQLKRVLAELGELPPRGTSEPQQGMNIGWTLGNACPYTCPHCYSAMIRKASQDITREDVDRIVGQLADIGVRTVNLGGNEPLFTSGPDPRNTQLPYIIRSLHEAGIIVGLTTAGITMTYMDKHHPKEVALLNDCDISLDSPFKEEHNENRGANLFDHALRVAKICRDRGIDRTFVMCGMRWNLSKKHMDALVELAKREQTFMRINFMKPTEPEHMDLIPTPEQFYETSKFVFENCDVIELGEPLGSAMSNLQSRGCPCGTASFRIHSKTSDGKVPLSPCVYGHAFKGGHDLLKDDLSDIIRSEEFEAFRQRRREPETIGECTGCEFLESCRGGCPSRAYLARGFEGGNEPFKDIRDPYCLRDYGAEGLSKTPDLIHQDKILVHRDYLCTLIFAPKA